MKKLSFYEQVGIVIPGAVLLFGLIFYFPPLQTLVAKDGINVGGLGIFVLLAYAVGHLVAGVGNFIEAIMWWLYGGMPTVWIVTRSPPALLESDQVAKLRKQIGARLGIAISKFSSLETKAWWPISRQIYSDVSKSGQSQRIDVFNGNYGLNRGLCAATLIVSIVAIYRGDQTVALTMLVASAIYLFRTQRFGVYYARELFVQFLLLPASKSKNASREPAQSTSRRRR